jgi:hypothetical protein
MPATALAGEERAALHGLPAVLRKVRDREVAERLREAREQRRERHLVAADGIHFCHRVHFNGLVMAHHGSCAWTRVVAGMRCRSSGGIASRRSAPDITDEKTGAATSPP